MNDTEHTSPRRDVEDDPAGAHADARNPEAEAADASGLARHRDPSLAKHTEAMRKAGRGVEWVRPSELLISRSGRFAGRGIDLQTELARRARLVPGQTYRAARTGAVSARARRLPPVTAFGRGAGERTSPVSRSGIGLG